MALYPWILPGGETRVRNEDLGGPNPFEWKDVFAEDLFKGKNIVVFSLPGAFAPTCSTSHLPRYEELYNEFKAQRIDGQVNLINYLASSIPDSLPQPSHLNKGVLAMALSSKLRFFGCLFCVD